MTGHYEDSWEAALNGPWTTAKESAQRPCHYCGTPAPMTEPGRRWKAHKTCAQGNPSTGPLGNWDGEEHKPATTGSFGCGDPSAIDAISCAGQGTKVSCQLCPNSPTYWRKP